MSHNLANIPYWNENASTWNEAMADGSPFQKTLVELKTLEFLDIQSGMKVLDIACGNGQMSRCLAKLGADVTALDGSETMINLAQTYSKELTIKYHVADVTKPTHLQFLRGSQFDAILCNMALMDMDDINPVFQLAYKSLRKSGTFVFSITHPCFDKAVGLHLSEIHENEGTLLSKHFIKVQKYLTPATLKTRALPSLPTSHYFFHKPLETYLNAAFEKGFVMCGVAEPAFPEVSELTEHKGWHKLPDIPVVFIAKFTK
jgi:2-polyprenyl-3-methyl-5-hydroxy-6-metoxy-1,4-benzoquinol methylase